MAIYALVDPRTNAVRYIGKADDPEARLLQHVQPAQLDRYRSRKNSWLKGLLAIGLAPELHIIDAAVPVEQIDEAERFHIYMHLELGHDLTNGTAGGDGGAVTDPAALERIRAAHLGTKHSPETIEKMRASHRRIASDPKERERLRSISNGKPPVHVGEANNAAKLTEDQVREIRRLYGEGVSRKEIAEQFGTTYQNVWYIATRRAWAHVT